MKSIVFAICTLFSLAGHTEESMELSPAELKTKVAEVNEAQNRMS